ncbi:MAG: hypothetical protein HY905_14815 [Deltaproteobacteria bacterium]|nr:hypothetical protein [Deltaproteobacteria bacterium]
MSACEQGTILAGDASRDGDTETAADEEAGHDVADEGSETAADVPDDGCPSGPSPAHPTWIVDLPVATDGESAGVGAICAAPDGGVAVVGAVCPTGGPVTCATMQAWIVVLAADGTPVVQRRLTGGPDDRAGAVAVTPRSAGGWIIGADGLGSDGIPREAWLVAIDESGEILWQWTVPGMLFSLEPRAHGTYAACVGRPYLGADGEPTVLEIDDSGAILRQTRLAVDGLVVSCAPLADGGLVAVLDAASVDAAGVRHDKLDLLHVAADGRTAWRREHADWEWSEGDALITSVLVAPADAGALIALATRASTTTWELLGAGGDAIRTTVLEAPGGVALDLAGVAVPAGGGLVLAGDLDFLTGWIAAVGTDGAFIWQRSLDFRPGDYIDTVFAAAPTTDGGIAFFGTAAFGSEDWVAKFGAGGGFAGTCPALGCPAAALRPGEPLAGELHTEVLEPGTLSPSTSHAAVDDRPVVRVQPLCPE